MPYLKLCVNFSASANPDRFYLPTAAGFINNISNRGLQFFNA
jgi:hypothetical protein